MHTDRKLEKRSGRTRGRVALACLVLPAMVIAGCRCGRGDLDSESSDTVSSASASASGSVTSSHAAASSTPRTSAPHGFFSSCSKQTVAVCKSSSNDLKCPDVDGEGVVASDVQVIVDANNDETGRWWSWLLAPGAIDAPGCKLQTNCAGSYRSIQYDAEFAKPASRGTPQCVKIEGGQPVQSANSGAAAARSLTPAQHAMEHAAKRMTEKGEKGVTVLAFDGMVDEKGQETVTADGFAKAVWDFVQADGRARGLFVVAAPAQYRYIYVIVGADRLGYGRELTVALKDRLSSNLGKKSGTVLALELSPGFRPEMAATEGRPLGDKHTKKVDDARRDASPSSAHYADVTTWLRGADERTVYDLVWKGRKPPGELKQLQAGPRLLRANVDGVRILGKGSPTVHWATGDGAALQRIGLEFGKKLPDCVKPSSQVVAKGQEDAGESCPISELGNVVRGYVGLDENPESAADESGLIAKLVVLRQTEDPDRGLPSELRDAGTNPGQPIFPALELVQTYDNSDRACVDAATKLAASLLLGGAPGKLKLPKDCSAPSKPAAEIVEAWTASLQSRYGAKSGKTGLDRRGGAYPLFVLMQRATESLRNECSLFRLETGVSCVGQK